MNATKPATRPTWQTEFADMPADACPDLGAGWRDASWHNDAAPCFIHDASGLLLWCSHPVPTLRDFPGEPRFSLVQLRERDPSAGWQHGEGERQIASFESVPDVLAYLAAIPLAFEFSRELRAEFDDDGATIAAIIAANETAAPGTCASHEHCDANMPMAAAFETIHGRAPDVGDAADAALWSAAWTIAAAGGFAVPEPDEDGPCPVNRRPKSTCPDGCDHGERPAIFAPSENVLERFGLERETAGGGCLILSRYLSNGCHVWATCEDGGGLPTSDDWLVCAYPADPEGGDDFLFEAGSRRGGPADTLESAILAALAAAERGSAD